MIDLFTAKQWIFIIACSDAFILFGLFKIYRMCSLLKKDHEHIWKEIKK